MNLNYGENIVDHVSNVTHYGTVFCIESIKTAYKSVEGLIEEKIVVESQLGSGHADPCLL
jgi:hypothetical protein